MVCARLFFLGPPPGQVIEKAAYFVTLLTEKSKKQISAAGLYKQV